MKPSVSLVKFYIEKFDGNDFVFGLLKTLKGVKASWTDEEKENVMERALGAILLALSNKVLIVAKIGELVYDQIPC
ncbi:hypothetical protein D8674_028948 [Pyrus ussuriensis x Pyrus communis]|uniref:Uncharacterized protein n=1 Tax=Pyrus ussuriensis x Pyrus communis TaxID=2448454 RepID=A0A5N5I2I2_9ROSA|nr:hypothetical protein D8674_028948 [Pyrus ussuriensis x Pyrus communis]